MYRCGGVMVKIEELEKELNQGILKNIYILYGEELFLLENALKKIKHLFGECIKGINKRFHLIGNFFYI